MSNGQGNSGGSPKVGGGSMDLSSINMDYAFMGMGFVFYLMTFVLSIGAVVNAMLLELYPTAVAGSLAVLYLVVLFFKVVKPMWSDVKKNPMIKI